MSIEGSKRVTIKTGGAPTTLGTACPKCGSKKSRVIDCRVAPHNQIRRRRECDEGHRYSTYENVDDDGAEG